MTRFVVVLIAAVVGAAPAQAQQPLAVYISADMEGIAGLSAMDDPASQRLMTEEVNAAIAGAFAAGATRVLVNDAHGSHANLLVERLDPRAILQRGNLKPYGMMEGLDGSFAAALLIGVHAKAGVPGAFAAHTGSGRVADLRVNGVSVGEAGMNALYAGWYGVPMAFLSGDSLAVEELATLVPTVEGAIVKTGIWGRAVHGLSPDSARARIRRGVERALRDPGTPMARADAYEVEMEYTTALFAEIAEGIPGVYRTGPRTVRFRVAEYPEAYRMIRVLYKHIGQ